MKVRIRCRKCGYETDVEVNPSPLGGLRPDNQSKGIKIKWGKDALDKALDKLGGLGASRGDLGQLGIEISKADWDDAEERAKVRRFLREHLRITKEMKNSTGEKFQVSTAPWVMGDSFKDIDLGSSEAKSLGVPDMRMIPGVTLQKRVYDTTKGQAREVLKGIKFINIVDVSGSMFGDGGRGLDKVNKALLLSDETWRLCKNLGYEFHLALFSDKAVRIPQKDIKAFFEDESERARYGVWRGGTTLTAALDCYSLDELKDANLVIMSDMDLADMDETRKKILEIAKVTNSFKILLIEYTRNITDSRIDNARGLFPNKEVQILVVGVET